MIAVGGWEILPFCVRANNDDDDEGTAKITKWLLLDEIFD